MCFFVFVDLRCCRSFSVSQRDFGLWCTASESSLRTMATVTPDVAAVDGELQKEVSTGGAASTDEAELATVDTQWLLLRLVEMINATPFLPGGFALINPFSAEEIEATTGIQDSCLSSRCKFNLFELKEGDVLLWNPHRTEAAIINFFLCRHGQLLLHISKLLLRTRTAATRIFQRTNEKTFVHWASLPNACLPTWISSKDDTFIVLPWNAWLEHTKNAFRCKS